MKKFTPVVGTAAALLFLAAMPVQAQTSQTALSAQKQQDQPTVKSDAKKEGKLKTLNNTMCPVSNEPVGSMGSGKIVEHKGYKISLCCDGCVSKFNKNPDEYLQAALKAEQSKAQQQTPQQQQQPINAQPEQQTQQTTAVKTLNNPNCPISGQPVGSMQEGSNIVYKGYKIGLCCDGCKAQFNKDPDKYLQALLKAEQQPKAAKSAQ